MIEIDTSSFEQRLNLCEITSPSINGISARIVPECLTRHDELRVRDHFESVRSRLARPKH